MFWYLSEHANTKKHVSEHSCSSVRVFFSILAHLAHLAQSFFLILNGINKCFDTCLSMQIQEHVSEHDWSSEWVILSILAHRAHLAQSYFSLIFSAFNTYNCSWFNLTHKKIAVTEDESMVKSDQCLWLFSSRRQPPLLIP